MEKILPFSLEDYQTADAELDILLNELKRLGIPQDLILKIDSKYNVRTSEQLAQHWIEGFKAGARFQLEILTNDQSISKSHFGILNLVEQPA